MSKSALKNIFVFILLVPLVVVIQQIAFKDHLLYGFRDMDWVFLRDFKNAPPFSFYQLVYAWKLWGVYTYQMYYIGIQDLIFGLNFHAFNITTQVFKALSVFSLFPLVLYLTRRRLIAFLTTLVYAFSYSSVGAMFCVVTSGNYLAVTVMNLFLLYYAFIVKADKNEWFWHAINLILFLTTMFLSTERMVPLVPLFILVEVFILAVRGFSKANLVKGTVRLAVLYLPILIVFILKPYVVTQFFNNTNLIINYVVKGNWQFFLTPFASLGSLFITNDYLRMLGKPNITNLSGFINFLMIGTLKLHLVTTLLSAFLVSKKPWLFVLRSIPILTVYLLIVYLISNHWLEIVPENRIHFDPGFVLPTVLISGIVLSQCACLFWEWVEGKRKNVSYPLLFGGILFSLVYIVITWAATDIMLVFMATQRYLTIPAIGASLVIATAIVLAFDKLKQIRLLKFFAWTPFLLVIPLLIISVKTIQKFFYDEVYFAGMHGASQTEMKSQLWSYLTNYTDDKKHLFYFDESADFANGYYHESAVLAGFQFWMAFRGDRIVNSKYEPALIRTNLYCPEPRRNCTDKLKDLVVKQDGVRGLMYNNVFYKPEDFYAFRLLNKKVIDIREETLKSIGLTTKSI